jgi:hypothetical protein
MDEDKATSRNSHALKVMLERIESYQAGRIHFAHLVSELDVGLSSLIGMDANWLSALRGEWRALEEVNALALDAGKVQPLDAHAGTVGDALPKMRNLIVTAQISIGG